MRYYFGGFRKRETLPNLPLQKKRNFFANHPSTKKESHSLARRQELRNKATRHEVLLWFRLRKSQLGYKFRRQYSFGPYVVDFYCPEKQLAIELDGQQHSNIEYQHYDFARTQYLEEFGMIVLRFQNEEIDRDIERVIKKIEQSFSKRETPPNLPLQRGEEV